MQLATTAPSILEEEYLRRIVQLGSDALATVDRSLCPPQLRAQGVDYPARQERQRQQARQKLRQLRDELSRMRL